MLKQYKKLFKKSLEGVDTTLVPNKYLKADKNFVRVSRPILKAKKSGFKKGLDFGCGSVGSSIIGHLYGIEVVGLDIPYGIDESKEGDRNRHGEDISKISKESVHLGIQKNLQKMGYKIFIRDTTEYPWLDFVDNEFDFVMAYFALSKEWAHHKDTLDFSGDIYSQRLKELSRITKPGGVWYVHPSSHINSSKKSPFLLQKKIIIKNWN